MFRPLMKASGFPAASRGVPEGPAHMAESWGKGWAKTTRCLHLMGISATVLLLVFRSTLEWHSRLKN